MSTLPTWLLLAFAGLVALGLARVGWLAWRGLRKSPLNYYSPRSAKPPR